MCKLNYHTNPVAQLLKLMKGRNACCTAQKKELISQWLYEIRTKRLKAGKGFVSMSEDWLYFISDIHAAFQSELSKFHFYLFSQKHPQEHCIIYI